MQQLAPNLLHGLMQNFDNSYYKKGLMIHGELGEKNCYETIRLVWFCH